MLECLRLIEEGRFLGSLPDFQERPQVIRRGPQISFKVRLLNHIAVPSTSNHGGLEGGVSCGIKNGEIVLTFIIYMTNMSYMIMFILEIL